MPDASAAPQAAPPVFAFLAFTSGSYEGAIIRDMRLANDLHRRGFKVHIYWIMEKNPDLVDKGIAQTWLLSGLRYQFKRPSRLLDFLGRCLGIFPAHRRRLFLNQHPGYVAGLMGNLMRVICDKGHGDPGLLNRLEKRLIADGVTHLLPTFAWTCPIAQRVKERGRAKFDYLPTFQGEEIFAHFAMRIGRIDDYHAALRDTITGSPWPAVAVSKDYIGRLHDEMGINPASVRTIYPGIELPEESDEAAKRRSDEGNAEGSGFGVQGSGNTQDAARGAPDAPSSPSSLRRFVASSLTKDQGQRTTDFAALKSIFRSLDPDLPMVTYLGRQDPEKGIDLLLYAARMLGDRGIKLQVVCVGGSSFGLQYRKSMEAIAEHLRLKVYWKGRVSNAVRGALFRQSRVVVYPSIHREPFGMVAAEAMSYGTPVLVPALGGITEVIEVDGKQGGLAFKAWDTVDLAAQLERLLTDDVLYAKLQADARPLSELFTVERMTDAVLAHMGLPLRP